MLLRRCEEQDAQGYVFLMGHTPEIHEKMRTAEAFLLTSDFEGLSNAMLEALAIGVPCICTDCPPGGARKYIQNGRNGFLVPVGGKEELVEAMSRIADSQGLRDALSKNAQTIRGELDAQAVCCQWERLM